MYHKVNDVPENSVDRAGRRASTSRWRSSASSATSRSPSTPCSTTTCDGTPLPPRRGADHVRRRLPRQPRERRADAAASTAIRPSLFVPIGYLAGTRPAAARRAPRRARDRQPHARLGASSPSSRRRGVRVESHGIGHRPLADLEVDEAAREITLSKLRLEERLGRPVRAFAYVKGSEAHYRLVHLSLLSRPATTSRSRRSPARTGRAATRSSCTATTSSRTRRGRSSSCSRARAT